MAERNRPRKSLISIADVLKTGDRMSTEDKGVVKYYAPELEIAVSALPATKQGGDFHGIVVLSKKSTAVFIGDVAGHDFSSTIPATEAVQYLDENKERLFYPHLLLRDLNRKLYPALNSVGRFLTMAVCKMDISTNTISYASAGHPAAVLLSGETGDVVHIGERMLPVGFEEDLSFALVQHEFLPGDSMLFFTDGLSSGRSKEKEEFGPERIDNMMKRYGHDSHAAVLNTLIAHKEFCLGSDDTDDCTIICVKRVS